MRSGKITDQRSIRLALVVTFVFLLVSLAVSCLDILLGAAQSKKVKEGEAKDSQLQDITTVGNPGSMNPAMGDGVEGGFMRLEGLSTHASTVSLEELEGKRTGELGFNAGIIVQNDADAISLQGDGKTDKGILDMFIDLVAPKAWLQEQ